MRNTSRPDRVISTYGTQSTISSLPKVKLTQHQKIYLLLGKSLEKLYSKSYTSLVFLYHDCIYRSRHWDGFTAILRLIF